jgi:hypothetical protein
VEKITLVRGACLASTIQDAVGQSRAHPAHTDCKVSLNMPLASRGPIQHMLDQVKEFRIGKGRWWTEGGKWLGSAAALVQEGSTEASIESIIYLGALSLV